MLICLGLDFRNADIRTRERFLPSEARLRAIRAASPAAPLHEVALLPTCNRIEAYGWAPKSGRNTEERAARAAARLWMGDAAGARALLEVATLRVDDEAVDHLFRVASGLESQVLGDIHILGQVRRAFREAVASNTLGAHLHRLFETALRCGKAVKRDTGLMAGRRSVGSEAGALLLRKMRKGRGRLVVVGTGKIGSHAARVLAGAEGFDLVLVNRTLSRAETLAASLGSPGRVRVAPFSRLYDELAEADGVLVASGSAAPVVEAPPLHTARAEAGSVERSLVMVDASMPRNVDGRCGALPGIQVLDLDALDPGVAAVERARMAAVPGAEAVVLEHRADYRGWRAEAEAREALRPLRELLSELCRKEVGFAAGDDIAGRATSRIVARLLAGPMTVLREPAGREARVREVADTLRLLFPEDAPQAAGQPGA